MTGKRGWLSASLLPYLRTEPDTEGTDGQVAREGMGARRDPLSAFCARLKRLQQASGLAQTAIARRVGLGKSQMSAIFNGEIKQLPDWNILRLVVRACLDHAEREGRPLSPDLRNEGDWRRRFSDLEQDTAVTERSRRKEPDAPGVPIGGWDPFTLGVHHPISGVWPSSESGHLPVLPPYLQREHDRRLRELLDPGLSRPLMVVLVGESCTGKTRAAYEAINSCLPTWRLLRPETSADLVRLLTGGTSGSEIVLWLNETQAYLDGEHGEEAAAALRRMLATTARVVVVGTMWSTDWKFLTARPPWGSPSHAQARELLEQSAVKIPVPASFKAQDLAEFFQLASNDPRLTEALNAASETGEIAQVLAGGPWLLDFYRNEATPYTKALLDAAIDCWILGYHDPLPAAALKQATAGYLDERQRAVSADWFDDALVLATTKIKGAVAPLTAVRTRSGAGSADGYLVADYLLEHTSGSRPRLLPADLWDALAAHATGADDHFRLAQSALARGYRRHAVLHFRSAVKSSDSGQRPIRPAEAVTRNRGDNAGHLLLLSSAERSWQAGLESPIVCELPLMATRFHGVPSRVLRRTLGNAMTQARQVDEALGKLAELLRTAGHTDEAMAALQRLATGPHFDDYPVDYPARELADLLARTGRIDEAIEKSQHLVDRGNNYAMEALAGFLEEAGKLDEAAAIWQRLAGRGDIYAMRMLAELLERANRIGEAMTVWQAAAERGETYAMEALAGLLQRAGRTCDAVAVWQPAAEAGEVYATRMLARLLEHTGQPEKAIALFRPGADRGDSSALESLGGLLERVGRTDEAIVTWQRLAAIDRTSDYPMRNLAGLLERVGRTDEAAAVWERADACGDPLAKDALAELQVRAGRIQEAITVWQTSAQGGDIPAMRNLAGLLERVGRTDEAAAVWERADACGDPLAKDALAELQVRAGRIQEAITVWQTTARNGDSAAMRSLAALLSKANLMDLAEWWLRNAVQYGDTESVTELAALMRMTGRTDEAEQLIRFGLEPGGLTADPWQ
jgi:tetratricopeptide (TPR) repeat protein/transcriptional regulator with XRE-family HTH domain